MLQNLSLKTLIRSIFIVVFALALVFGIALYFLLQSQNTVSRTQEMRFDSFNLSNMIRMYSQQLTTDMTNYAITNDRQSLENYERALAVTLGQAPRPGGQQISNERLLAELPLDSNERSQLGQGIQATNTMAKLEEQARLAIEQGRNNEALSLLTSPAYQDARVEMASSVNRAISDFVNRLEAQLDHEYKVNSRLVTLMIVLVVLFVLLSVLVGWLLNQMVLNRLGAEPAEMERVATAIAEGDLSLSFEANAEGVYANLQHMTVRLRDVIGHIHKSSLSLSAAAEETSAISAQTNQNLNRQQLDTDQVATAVNELSATIREVSNNTSLAASSAHSANEAAEQGKNVVQNTVASIGKLADDVMSTGQVVQSLADSSTQIGSVVQAIQDIADQTNLLALNAAIEAARAGDQGRGFSVVADEVRQLAGQTQVSSQEIISTVAKLQADAEQAIQAINAGRQQAELTVNEAQEAEQALEVIREAVQTISDMNIQISTAIEEQATVTEDISRNLTGIREIGEETATGAAQTSSASRELSELAAGLQQVVQEFKLN